MQIRKFLDPGMSSIPQLQGTCNTHERRLTAKLVSLLAASDEDGKTATIATFETDGATLHNVGNAAIVEGSGNTAFIKNEVKKVSISRN